MRSNKKDDPLKVGRFGIGFNSVYHITDLPSIVSGTYVAFLDPHESLFGRGEPGKRFSINLGLRETELFDQFAPFHDTFGCDLSSGMPYHHTLFRFPLRKTSESKLSKTVYNESMINNLFESLRQDASIILLYLKCVQSISICRRSNDGQVKCVFKVEMSDDTREQVIMERDKLLTAAIQTSVVESKYVIGVNIATGKETKGIKWLVVNQIGSTNNEQITHLGDKLHLLPWIGLALPVDEGIPPIKDGRIFCFLPLPPDVDCRSGLPVHIHGYFGLNDNRRGLTWPGVECQNNETAEWNKLLLTEIASSAYCKILEALIKNQPSTGLSEDKRCQLVYSTMPVLKDVRGHWQCILDPLFQQMIHQPVFYAQTTFGNSWVTLDNGVLDLLHQSGTSQETRKIILKVLKGLYAVITDLPSYVQEIIETYFPSPSIISPDIVRRVLKQSEIGVTEISREEKLNLLRYVLSDGKTTDITDIPLLPLADKSFIQFRGEHKHISAPQASVLVPSENCTRELLPNMSDRFLDESLEENIKSKLSSIAATKTNVFHSTQLVRLTSEIVVDNMRSSLPSTWFKCNNDKVLWQPGTSDHPPESWLKATWKWINESFPTSLTQFEGIPLLPVDNQLGILSSSSKFVFSSEAIGTNLPTQVCDLLSACGCSVLTNLPGYISCHKDINTYVAPPTPSGVLRVLSRISMTNLVTQATRILTSEKLSIFREFFSRVPNQISNSERSLLLQLPLFDRLHGTVTAAHQLKAVPANINLPTGFQLLKDRVLIVSIDVNVEKLLNVLNVPMLLPADMLIGYVFPDILAGRYNDHQIDVLMQWILEQIGSLKSQNDRFLSKLKNIAFVSTDSGVTKRPAELYDPNDAVLRDILSGKKDVFPSGFYATSQLIATLKCLGLKTKETLTASDLFGFAQMVASDVLSSPVVARKVNALFKILNDNPSYLNHCSSRATLREDLTKLRWIPCATIPPSTYPNFVQWYNKPALLPPSEVRISSKALLIGSSMPTIDININSELEQAFGLARDPPLFQVIQQLQAAMASWKSRQEDNLSAIEVAKFQEMLIQIYCHLSRFPANDISSAIATASLMEWIWHGEGFCSPKNAALSRDFTFDLRPRLFIISKEFRSNSTLVNFFLRHGVKKMFSGEDILDVLDSIREKHANPTQPTLTEVTQDLAICGAVLQWVVKDGNVLPEHLQEKVFVPVQSSNDVLVLATCKKCTYCDRDWLRKGGSDLDIPEDYQVIHSSVSVEVARLLGVPALSTCLLSAETMGFEQTGPNESITNRISTILNEYPEGNGIFKELVQNADDAGATVVRFLVDWRNGPTEKLLSPNMAACQGPALWAYNNEEFSDNDFVNINKLAGATKVKEVGKIGRFGLGFNAVYHLTDVPSFVSRQYFVLFDPNVNHIDNHISNKSRPGIRIDLASNARPLSAFEDQFQPYHGVFGCNTQMTDGMKFNFNGTLFRFPFRTSCEAIKSEICQSVFNKDKVKQIVSSLKECSPLLLLFTQHVTQVELYEIEDGFELCDMKLLLSISKEPPEIKRSSYLSSSRCPFLEDCSKWWEHKLTNSTGQPGTPSRCEIFEVIMKEMQSKLLCSHSNSETHETWLVTSCAGTSFSVSLALTKEGRSRGLLPCGGAALRLDSQLSYGASAKSCSEVNAVKGEIFCFLPLSISTGLPVHVNGYFAITSNRRGIWERTTSHQDQQMEVQWNEYLLQDPLCTAYLQLLNDVKTIQTQDYDFYLLWPVYDKLQSATWEVLVKSVYDRIVSNSLPLFYSDGKWLSINEGYILDVELCKIPEVRDSLKRLNKNVFAIPSQVVSSLIKAGLKQTVDQSTLDLKTFLEKLFLPNVYAIDTNIRDPIVCHILDCILSGRNEFLTMLFTYPCITCSQDGQHLAKPSRLISPNGAVACLFSAEDNRFPVGDCFQTKNRLYALEQLGMVKDQISWSEICDRATSVKILAKISKDKAVERTRNLIKYLNENIGKLTTPDSNTVSVLQSTEFLPFISTCPDGYKLAWEGSKFNKKQLFSPKNAFLSSEKNLVGSSCVILDESEDTGCGELGREVKKLLGFLGRLPTVDQVIRQLDAAICETNIASLRRKSLESVCKRVYKFFDDFVAKVDRQETRCSQGTTSYYLKEDPLPGELLKQLNQRPWLLVEGHFVSTKQVAYRWNGNGAPYLYGLPFEYRDRYDELLKMVRVKKTFSSMDFIGALKSLKKAKKDNPLNDDEIKLAVCFATELKGRALEGSHVGRIPLPDSNNVLCLSGELTINLTFWLKDRGDARYVHQDIPPQLALDLGAKSLHNRRLKKYSNTFGTPFGQHEKLTDRLKNILKSYPCDSGILKELVQNADDAGASEIHFIYDTRKLAHEKVVQEHADEVQGPALCVYNNRPFTREDLEGIQQLGIGSKTDDPEKTGQYGIGFNAVYHLTDCPSFLSNEDTLCFLDPHCRYAPDATPDCPGELFQPIDEAFKEDFKDVLLGYLGEHFKLKGATMFRLPLRTLQRSEVSLISHTFAENDVIKELLEKFKAESKKMLLFLNYVKAISLSEIDKDGRLKQVYSVAVNLESENEEKRRELSHIVKRNKHLHTCDIAWNGFTYPLTISDSAELVETWLVHQCCGTSSQATEDSIVDGRIYGLFSRGGIATQIIPQRSFPGYQQEHVAYCFLPLPVYTSLPVHVNGHFALDSSRRNLWHDTDRNSPLTKWNNFIKMSVLAPGYATLILEARQYISFSQEIGKARLLWYHQLFPNPSKDSLWSVLAREVYRYLGSNKLEVLPVVVAGDIAEVTRARRGSNDSSKDVIHSIRSWLSVEDAYFLGRKSQTKLAEDKENGERKPHEDRLFKLLLRVNFPLLCFTPTFVYDWFMQAEITCQVLTPMNVIKFLKCFAVPNSKCQVGNLPVLLKETNIKERLDLKVLIDYCKMEKLFPTLLEGLPLLLTADGQLRIFDANNPVFRSKFSDLFPEKANLFVHPDLVNSLPDIGNHLEKQVMQQFTVISLDRLLPSIFPASMKNSCDHVLWEFPPNGPLSRKWFQRLWDFLEEYTIKSSCPVMSLSVLGAWPVIPTTSDKLVTINNGKTVLDATHRRAATTQEKRIREILQQLHCPTLNTEITVKKQTNPKQILVPSMPGEFLPMLGSASVTQPTDHGSHVTDLHVAQPRNVRDVLQVLDFMRRTGSLNTSRLTSDDLVTVLKFIQDDLNSLNGQLDAATIKKLPFYIGINGTHFSLSEYSDYAIIPRGVPTSEIGELQHHTRCLFLHPEAASFLHSLYKWLGVEVELSLYEFYIKYIIPQFNRFKRENQIAYLIHIKNDVLPFLHALDRNQFVVFVNLLSQCLCIPDEDGILHYAREFHDPRNKVFRMMLQDNSKHFPPSTFQSPEWLDFLCKIGIKTKVEECQFLKFCEEVASDACRSTDRAITVEKSKLLVKYLFDNAHLRSEKFLCSVSRIKFVASEKVESSLTSLHKQFKCNTAEDKQTFVQFLDAVPWKYHVLTWTSTQLLPSWAQPCQQLLPCLGVQEVPSVESIVTHLQNLACTLAEICKRSEELPQPTLLKKIMESIYEGLNKQIECKENEDTSDCCRECRSIGERLQNIPCVLVEDGKAMITGNKLSFSVQVNCAYSFIPFLYAVPRKYFAYYHLLKRLGATEQFTSLQFASVLKAIKEQCQDSKMNPNLFAKAKAATSELFQSLLVESNDGNKTKICDLKELFLPSEKEILVKSSDLVRKIAPSVRNALASRPNFNVMLPLEKCDLPREKEEKYFNALAPHLRPKLMESLFKEELDSNYLEDRCFLCKEDSLCEFVKRYIMILKSAEFQSGIIRLLKHKKNSSEITQEEQDRLSVFGTDKLDIICMRNINVHFVDTKTEEPLENSSFERSCYVVEKSSSWKLYIKHGTGQTQATLLSHHINEISRWLFNADSLRFISTMLLCESPSEIPGALDELDISKDFSEEELKIGREVPVVFHFHLQQNPLFIFHEGEIIAYGVEMNDTDDIENGLNENEGFTGMKYVLGKVISRTGNTETDGLYDFTAQYLIDLGTERKTVSVIDLYKFVQNDAAENQITDIIPSTGGATSLSSSLDETKEEIREAVCRGWRLPHGLRRKVIRRLYLRWHPDKNPGNVECAKEMFEYLLSEVKRLEAEESEIDDSCGFTSLFTGWSRQARRERETYRNFREHFGGSTRSASGYTSPNVNNANRWLKQAQSDLEAAQILILSSQSFDALVCFLSHQVVEKSLKAALYAKCGLSNDQLHTHDVYALANHVSRLESSPAKITNMAIVVSDYYLSTRYPNRQPGCIVPADAFSKEQSTRALENAIRLLNAIRTFIIA